MRGAITRLAGLTELLSVFSTRARARRKRYRPAGVDINELCTVTASERARHIHTFERDLERSPIALEIAIFQD